MSDPSFNDTVNQVKGTERKVTAKERDFWNNSKPKARINILKGRLADVASNYLGLETATENAYQQDYTAKINQLINTNYDSLPESVRTTITEALIGQGALPNPRTYKGVGHEFAVGKEVFIECDRCDEEFLSEEDFEMHKEIDHGDYENAEEQEVVEDIFANTMDPDISLEAFKEARRALTETDEGDLHRSVYFNGDKFPQPTIEEPDDVKGKKGYDDNPNKGLYDNKIFVKGKSTSRYGGVVSESFSKEVKIAQGDLYQNGQKVGTIRDYNSKQHEGYVTLDGIGIEEFGAMTSDYEVRVNGERIPNKWDGKHDYNLDLFGEAFHVKVKNAKTGEEEDLGEVSSREEAESVRRGVLMQGLGDEWFVTIEGNENVSGITEQYEGDGEDVEYDQSQTLSDIKEVQEEDSGLDIPELDKIDFAEEQINYVYKTIKRKANEVEEKDPFLEEYGDDDIESDKEAVENQIVSRKLHGYSAETIAREITIQYGVSHDEALERVYSIEVSVNDKVANTFFGKRFHECTEAEKNELKMYSGSDTEDDEV